MLRIAVSLLGTLLFIGFLLIRIDIAEVGDAFTSANYAWLLPALAVYFLSIGLRSLRWRYLLRPGGTLPLGEIYRLVVIGYMANNVLPVRAGELIRMYMARQRWGLSQMSTLGTIAVERVFDGLVLVLFLMVAAAFVGVSDLLRGLALVMLATFATIFALLFVLATSPKRAKAPLAALLRRFPERMAETLRAWGSSFVDGLLTIRSRDGQIVITTTTIAAWLLEAVMYYLVGFAFGLSESFVVFLMVTGAANLAIAIPISQGGIGPFELFTTKVLVLAGVGSAGATAYAIALHVVLLVPLTLLGVCLLWSTQSLKAVFQPSWNLPRDVRYAVEKVEE